MAATTGNTTLSRTNIVVTTSVGDVVSNPNNYLPLSVLDGDGVFTLPDATENSGKQFIIDNDSGSAISIETVSGQTINGGGSFTLQIDNSIILIAHRGNWRIISSHII